MPHVLQPSAATENFPPPAGAGAGGPEGAGDAAEGAGVTGAGEAFAKEPGLPAKLCRKGYRARLKARPGDGGDGFGHAYPLGPRHVGNRH